VESETVHELLLKSLYLGVSGALAGGRPTPTSYEPKVSCADRVSGSTQITPLAARNSGATNVGEEFRRDVRSRLAADLAAHGAHARHVARDAFADRASVVVLGVGVHGRFFRYEYCCDPHDGRRRRLSLCGAVRCAMRFLRRV
jgi:hypothetical protein